MGGWVGGWVEEMREDEAVRMSCCMGGWVEDLPSWMSRSHPSSFSSTGEKIYLMRRAREGGWVGGWVGGKKKRPTFLDIEVPPVFFFL